MHCNYNGNNWLRMPNFVKWSSVLSDWSSYKRDVNGCSCPCPILIERRWNGRGRQLKRYSFIGSPCTLQETGFKKKVQLLCFCFCFSCFPVRVGYVGIPGMKLFFSRLTLLLIWPKIRVIRTQLANFYGNQNIKSHDMVTSFVLC